MTIVCVLDFSSFQNRRRRAGGGNHGVRDMQLTVGRGKVVVVRGRCSFLWRKDHGVMELQLIVGRESGCGNMYLNVRSERGL